MSIFRERPPTPIERVRGDITEAVLILADSLDGVSHDAVTSFIEVLDSSPLADVGDVPVERRNSFERYARDLRRVLRGEARTSDFPDASPWVAETVDVLYASSLLHLSLNALVHFVWDQGKDPDSPARRAVDRFHSEVIEAIANMPDSSDCPF